MFSTLELEMDSKKQSLFPKPSAARQSFCCSFWMVAEHWRTTSSSWTHKTTELGVSMMKRKPFFSYKASNTVYRLRLTNCLLFFSYLKKRFTTSNLLHYFNLNICKFRSYSNNRALSAFINNAYMWIPNQQLWNSIRTERKS